MRSVRISRVAAAPRHIFAALIILLAALKEGIAESTVITFVLLKCSSLGTIKFGSFGSFGLRNVPLPP